MNIKQIISHSKPITTNTDRDISNTPVTYTAPVPPPQPMQPQSLPQQQPPQPYYPPPQQQPLGQQQPLELPPEGMPPEAPPPYECPKCGAPIETGQQKCVCGIALNWGDSGGMPPEAPPPDVCGKCGATLEKGQRKCGQCGFFLHWEEEEEKEKKTKPKAKPKSKKSTRPPKEFWDKVYPQVEKYYKKRLPKTFKKRAEAVTADIWYHKISPEKKAIYEYLRTLSEIKLSEKCPKCGTMMKLKGAKDTNKGWRKVWHCTKCKKYYADIKKRSKPR